MKMRLGSFKFRVLAAFLTCFVAAQLGLLYTNLNILEQDHVAQVKRRAQGLGAVLDAALASMLAERNYTAAWQVLEEQRHNNRIAYFLLYRSDGRVVAEGGWGMGKGAPPQGETYFDQDGDGLFHTAIQLSYAGSRYGELRYGVSTEGMAEAKSRLVRHSLLFGSGIVLAIAALFGFTLRPWLDREFRGMITASESIAAGNFDIRVHRPDSTEFALLADAFNRMSGAIKARIEELRESAKRLNEAQSIAHLGSWELDMVTNELMWSDETCRIFEIDPDSFGATYAAFLDVVHPEDLAMVDRAYTEAVANHTPYDIVHRLCIGDGRIKYVRERGGILYDADSGEPCRCFGTVQDITEQELARKALQESERYQTALLANLPVAVAVHLPDDTVIYGNTKAAELFGLTEEQARSLGSLKPSWNFLAENGSVIPGQSCPIVRAVLESGKPVDNIILGVLLEGAAEPLWLLASGYPDIDGEGRLRQVVVSFVDITIRRRAEDMLRETRAKLQRIVDVSPAATYVIKLDSAGGARPRIAFLSQQVSAITGYGQEEWAQAGFWEDHIHPDDRERVVAALTALPETETLQQEYRFLRRDGSEIWILDRLVLVRDERGSPIEAVGSWLDITEQRRAVLRLQHMNRLYTLLSRVNEAIVRVGDSQALFDAVCRIAVEEGGFVMAWIGTWEGGDAEVVPVAKRGRDEGYLDGLRRLGVLRQCPTATALRLGEARLLQDIDPATAVAPWCKEAVKRGYQAFGAFPIRRGGQVTGSFNLYADTPGFFSDDIVRLVEDVAQDVSFALDSIDQDRRRQQAEEEVRRLNEELEQRVAERTRLLEAANQELEAFSYSVSHDLRAPLRSIDGFSQILLRKFSDCLDGTGQDYLRRVCRASQRMGELIDDLLQLSRVSRSNLQKKTINLSHIARDVAQALREEYPEREVEFVTVEGIVAEADGRLMRVVLDNLLGNAWKFTGRRETPRIEFGAQGREGETVYYVRDNGAGFDMQYADKLFGPFQRLHKEDEFDGSGIGLATVQRIVSRHGGRVWAEGEVGKGAAFYFTL